MRPILFSAIVLCTSLFNFPAGAAETVFGDTNARKCYESARFGLGGSGLDACNRALRNPGLSKRDRAATLVNRGILFNRQKRVDDAFDDFNAALKINARLGEAYLNRGNSYFFSKRIKAALEDYDRAIRHNSPELHAAYFNRGLAHEVLGQIEEAREDYEQALALKPDFELARLRLEALPKGKVGGKPTATAASGRAS